MAINEPNNILLNYKSTNTLVRMKHKNNTITFIFNEDNSKVLMVERVKRFGFDWGYLSGKIEGTEEPITAAKREIQEELALENLELKFLEKKEYNKDNETFYHYYFKTNIPENTLLKIQKEEVKQAKWFLLSNLPENRAPDEPERFI